MALIKRGIRKFRDAFRGLIYGLSKDQSIITQALIAIIVIGFSLFMKLEKYDLIIIIIMCSLVLVTEMINSTLELLSDYACDNQYSEDIKRIKDLGAGAVLMMSIMSVVVGIIIFYKYLF